jgi:hypothetical protein
MLNIIKNFMLQIKTMHVILIQKEKDLNNMKLSSYNQEFLHALVPVRAHKTTQIVICFVIKIVNY